MIKWLVFDVGCIECGEESRPIGVYVTKEEAERIAEEYTNDDTRWGRPEWTGQHYVETYEIDV